MAQGVSGALPSVSNIAVLAGQRLQKLQNSEWESIEKISAATREVGLMFAAESERIHSDGAPPLNGSDRAKPCDHFAALRRKAAPPNGTVAPLCGTAAPSLGTTPRRCAAAQHRGTAPRCRGAAT
jgi:hypothetical protein